METRLNEWMVILVLSGVILTSWVSHRPVWSRPGRILRERNDFNFSSTEDGDILHFWSFHDIFLVSTR